jgi:hypothetical protein
VLTASYANKALTSYAESPSSKASYASAMDQCFQPTSDVALGLTAVTDSQRHPDALGALRREIEETVTREDIGPASRINKLEAWHQDIEDLLERIETYISDLRLLLDAQSAEPAPAIPPEE